MSILLGVPQVQNWFQTGYLGLDRLQDLEAAYVGQVRDEIGYDSNPAIIGAPSLRRMALAGRIAAEESDYDEELDQDQMDAERSGFEDPEPVPSRVQDDWSFVSDFQEHPARLRVSPDAEDGEDEEGSFFSDAGGSSAPATPRRPPSSYEGSSAGGSPRSVLVPEDDSMFRTP